VSSRRRPIVGSSSTYRIVAIVVLEATLVLALAPGASQPILVYLMLHVALTYAMVKGRGGLESL